MRPTAAPLCSLALLLAPACAQAAIGRVSMKVPSPTMAAVGPAGVSLAGPAGLGLAPAALPTPLISVPGLNVDAVAALPAVGLVEAVPMPEVPALPAPVPGESGGLDQALEGVRALSAEPGAKLFDGKRETGKTGIDAAEEPAPAGADQGASMNDDQWKGHIRALIYPVQFSEKPAAEVDRVLDLLSKSKGSSMGKEALAEAVRLALAQKESLAGLIPQDHSEAEIRAYLEAVLKKLGRR